MFAGMRSKTGGFAAAGLLFVIELDDDRLEEPFVAPVDGHHLARSGRGVAYGGQLLVFEKHLATDDTVSDGDLHGRLHAVIVVRDHGDSPRRAGLVDELLGLADDRQGHTLLDLVNSHRKIDPLGRGGPGSPNTGDADMGVRARNMRAR